MLEGYLLQVCRGSAQSEKVNIHFCVSLLHFLLSLRAPLSGHLHLWNSSRCVDLFVRSQTKYPSLTSSCATAALLMLPPVLEPPPRLEAAWTTRKSREGAGLGGRTRDDDEAAEAEDLDKPGCLQGSTTVLITEEKRTCPQYWNNRNLNGIHRDSTSESYEIYPRVSVELS